MARKGNYLSKGDSVAEDTLRHLYQIEGLSTREAARELGVNKGTILSYLRKYDIPTRSLSEAARVRFEKPAERDRISASVSGSRNHEWKGGRIRTVRGYIRVCCPDHPRADCNGYVLEHRLVMEKEIKRYLSKSEYVHHINGVKDDNRVENLRLVSSAAHNLQEQFCHNCPLKKEIRLLRWQIKELTEALQLKLQIG